MQAVKLKNQKSVSDNAIAKKALEAIAMIDREAEDKKKEQLQSLQEAKAAIHERLNELTHQLSQVELAISHITGKPVKGAKPEGTRTRRDWSEVRERVVRWMAGRAGQKFGAGELVKEFPELEGQVVSVLLRPSVQAGQVDTDITDGIRRTKYSVKAG